MNQKLLVNVNGVDKIATGFTLETTFSDLKFAMLSASIENFHPRILKDFILIEKWQNYERILDESLNIFKIIKAWSSLTQVKILIRHKSFYQFDYTNQIRSRSRSNLKRSNDIAKESSKRYASIRRLSQTRESSVKRKTENGKMSGLEKLQQDLAHVESLIMMKTCLIRTYEKEYCQKNKMVNKSLSNSSSSSSINSSNDTGFSSALSLGEEYGSNGHLETLV